MKSINEIKKVLFATLSELESIERDENNVSQKAVRSKLSTLYEDVLDESDVPEEYWERIESQM